MKRDEFQKMIATKLRAIRKSKRLSQYALSKKTGINRSTITQVEIGGMMPTIYTLHHIAQGLGITIDELVN